MYTIYYESTLAMKVDTTLFQRFRYHLPFVIAKDREIQYTVCQFVSYLNL